jgi:hypothetical protein
MVVPARLGASGRCYHGLGTHGGDHPAWGGRTSGEDIEERLADIEIKLTKLVEDEVYYARQARESGLSPEAFALLVRPIADQRAYLQEQRRDLIQRAEQQRKAGTLRVSVEERARQYADLLPHFTDDERTEFLRHLDAQVELHADNSFDVTVRLPVGEEEFAILALGDTDLAERDAFRRAG